MKVLGKDQNKRNNYNKRIKGNNKDNKNQNLLKTMIVSLWMNIIERME